jgi:hypothetical protein
VSGNRRWACVALALSLAIPLGIATAPAQGCDAGIRHEFGVSPGCFDLQVSGPPTALNLAPDFTGAGGHPFQLSAAIRLNAPDDGGGPRPPEPVKDMLIGLPPGLVAGSSAVGSCSMAQLSDPVGNPTCPPDSQVGLLEVFVSAGPELASLSGIPLFNLDPPPGVAARLGFSSAGFTGVTDAELGSDAGSGITIAIRDIGREVIVDGAGITLWGAPADPRHTPWRACPGQPPPTPESPDGGPSCAAGAPVRPFLRLPTSCAAPATASLRVDSWNHPGEFLAASVTNHLTPGLVGDPADLAGYPAPYPGLEFDLWGPPQSFTGCAELPFAPALTVQPTDHASDSPVGLGIELSFPQTGANDVEAASESDLRSMVATLPAALSINPAAAAGLSACSAAEIDLVSTNAPACPQSSRLGTVEIDTPLREEPLLGSIYLAAPEQGSTATLPLYLAAGSGGLNIKLRAVVAIDRTSGEKVVQLSDLPQLPIGHLRLQFPAGSQALFATPPICGAYAAEGRFTPWARPGVIEASDAFEVTSGPGGRACATSLQGRPFGPGFSAGLADPGAGRSGALTMKLTRADGEQEISSFETSLPPGLMASLRGVSTCPEVAIAATAGFSGSLASRAPACPASSRVGDVAVAVGVGDRPLSVAGGLYLAGPYAGSPFSLAIVVPALGGPIDFGNLAFRLGLSVDPAGGRIRLSGALPELPPGVVLHLREIALSIDRPGFILNPTHCKQAPIAARIVGDGGAVADVSTPLRVGGCRALGFEPKLGIRLMGGPLARRHSSHPRLRTVVATRRGDANIRRAVVTLPDSLQLDPSHIRKVCLATEFEAGRCPRSSIYGFARAVSPLLDRPLRGPVYMRSSRYRLPDLAADLDGQLKLDLSARVGFSHGRVRIVFARFPDLPVSRFVLTMRRGRRGVLVNNRHLCAAPSFATARLTAQNGERSTRTVRVRVPCGSHG